MSEQYYKIVSTGEEYEADGKWHNVILEPVDTGWRWCKDELPEEMGYYLICSKAGSVWYMDFDGENFHVSNLPSADAVQWCKLPEPLKEGER